MLHNSAVSRMAGIVNSLQGGDGVTELVDVDLEGHGRGQPIGEAHDLHHPDIPPVGQRHLS